MTQTISREIRNLIRDYYSYSGEKVRVTDKIERLDYCGNPEFAYVCKVTDENKNVVWTVVDASGYDAHGNKYATELFSDSNKDIVVDSWVHDPESDDDVPDFEDDEWPNL